MNKGLCSGMASNAYNRTFNLDSKMSNNLRICNCPRQSCLLRYPNWITILTRSTVVLLAGSLRLQEERIRAICQKTTMLPVHCVPGSQLCLRSCCCCFRERLVAVLLDWKYAPRRGCQLIWSTLGFVGRFELLLRTTGKSRRPQSVVTFFPCILKERVSSHYPPLLTLKEETTKMTPCH